VPGSVRTMLLFARHGECAANAERCYVGRRESPLTPRGERQARRLAHEIATDESLRVARIVTSPLGRAVHTAEIVADALARAGGPAPRLELDQRFVELDYGDLDGQPFTPPGRGDLASAGAPGAEPAQVGSSSRRGAHGAATARSAAPPRGAAPSVVMTPAGGAAPGGEEAWHLDPTVAVPNGESLAEVAVRVCSACEELYASASERSPRAAGGPEVPAASAPAPGDVLVVSHVSPIKLAVCWALGASIVSVWRMDLAVASLTRVSTRGSLPHLERYNEHDYLGEDASPPIWR